MKGASSRTWALILASFTGILIVAHLLHASGPGELLPLNFAIAPSGHVSMPAKYAYELQRGLPAYLATHEIPMRKLGVQSREITSYNVRGYNYDYGNYLYLDSSRNEMVVMEDEGSGCVYRLFLIFNHQVQNYHLFRLILRIDGAVVLNLTLKEVLHGQTFPFIPPLSGARTAAHQGLYTSIPICYSRSIRMSFWHASMYNGRNFNRVMMYSCVETASYCHHMPIWNVDWHQYSTPIPRSHVFPSQYSDGLSNATSFWRRIHHQLQHTLTPPPFHQLETTAQRLPQFTKSAFPTSGTWPRAMTLFASNSSGVITQLFISIQVPRARETGVLKSLGAWNDVTLTIHFDGSMEPQIDHVPLGFFFGASLRHWLHRAQGYLLGVMPMDIIVENNNVREWVGYIYFPMPYWKSISIQLHANSQVSSQATVYHAVVVHPNTYPSATTGHFTVQFVRTTPSHLWRPFPFLHVKQGWGHVVGVNLFLEGLRDIIQGDPQLFYDHSKSALIHGTGIEDWFNYAHGWEFQEPRNQSDALSGVPAKGVGGYYISDKRNPRKKVLKLHGDRALINGVHAYRRMPVDCIIFNDGIRGHFEVGSNWTHNNYRSAEDMATTTFLYMKPQSGSTRIEVISMANTTNEGVQTFTIQSKYMGDINGRTLTMHGKVFAPNHPLTFTVQVPPQLQRNYGIILRRTYDAEYFNQKATLMVDGVKVRTWLTLGGNPVSRFAEADVTIASELTNGKSSLTFTVHPISMEWRDIAYEVFVLH